MGLLSPHLTRRMPGTTMTNTQKVRTLGRINLTLFKIEETTIYNERIKTARRIATPWGESMTDLSVEIGN